MINKLLLSLLIALSISACHAETDTSSEKQLSPELETQIEQLNEARDAQIKKVKAMHLSKENEEKYIAEVNNQVDGAIAGLVMQKEMERSPEEIASSNKRARDQYERAFGTEEQRAEQRRKAREDRIDKSIRQQARRELYEKREREKELRRLEKRDEQNAEYIARLKRDQEIADQRQARADRELEKFNAARKASKERMLKIREAAELKRQQRNQY